jgi:hypothetical protein
LHTPAEVRDFYEQLLGSRPPHSLRIGRYIEQGKECAFELERAPSGDDWALAAIDRFTLGPDHKIQRFAVFFFNGVPASGATTSGDSTKV